MRLKAVTGIVLTLLLMGMLTLAFNFDGGHASAGGAWLIETVDSGRMVGHWSSIALDSYNWPHISYNNDSGEDLKYAYYNGTTWHTETVDDPGPDENWTGDYTSIALDSDDNPHISYHAISDGDLNYAFHNGTAWRIETVDNASWRVGYYTSIALDSGDNIHISYFDYANNDLKYAYYNGTWHIEIVDSAGRVGRYTSIALDSGDNPHVSYYDGTNTDLKYAYYNGTTWHKQTVDSAGDVGRQTSIALDSGDNPHISYYDLTISTNFDLNYAFYDGTTWHIETVDSLGNTDSSGIHTSIALDSGDNPHISYYELANENLKYAYYNGTWHIETVDSAGKVGWHNSIALDSGDNPHISYYDRTNGDLKYARAHVTIKAHCSTWGADASVSITMDGSPTGYTTPHTFTGLTGTHNFTVPSTDTHDHPFTQWSTNETNTTITVTSAGTYTAYYGEHRVGGISVPVDKLGLLAPYICLAVTIIVATVATATLVKHKKKQ